MESFNKWLYKAKVTDDPAGDFIQDARRDSNFPIELKSRKRLEKYLALRNACQGARDTVPEVWRRYTNWRDVRSGKIQSQRDLREHRLLAKFPERNARHTSN